MVSPITIEVIQKDFESDRRFRERRHPQWTMNYTLSRDTVIVNRLTQRQSVNVPYMKNDVVNSQFLARRLLLETMGFWRYPPEFS